MNGVDNVNWPPSSERFALTKGLHCQLRFVYHSPTDAAPQFLQKLIPFTQFQKRLNCPLLIGHKNIFVANQRRWAGETLVAAGHVTTQNLGGRKICWKGGTTGFFYCHSDKFTKANVPEYPPTLRFWMDRWSRDQPQPGSLFQRLRKQRREILGTRLLSPLNELGNHGDRSGKLRRVRKHQSHQAAHFRWLVTKMSFMAN